MRAISLKVFKYFLSMQFVVEESVQPGIKGQTVNFFLADQLTRL